MLWKVVLCSSCCTLVGLLFSGQSFAQSQTAKVFEAEYQVPVSDETLEPFAVFHLDSYVVDTAADGTTTLSFLLPDDLAAGQQIRLAFTEVEKTSDARRLEGGFGQVHCTIPWLNSRCQITLERKILPRFSDMVNHVVEKYPIGAGWMERFDVLKRFSTEPVGIVRVISQKR